MNNPLGEMIRQIRIEKGFSQQQLADLIHVDRTTITNWERGRRLPDADMLSKISDTLSIDVSYLITASLNQNNSPNVIMVDDEKIILTGSIPVFKKVLPYIFSIMRRSRQTTAPRSSPRRIRRPKP